MGRDRSETGPKTERRILGAEKVRHWSMRNERSAVELRKNNKEETGILGARALVALRRENGDERQGRSDGYECMRLDET